MSINAANVTNVTKKFRRLNRKGRLIGKVDPEEEKKAIVESLMVKCGKTEEEVVKAFDEFHLKHESGQISKKEYKETSTVRIPSILSIFFCIFRTPSKLLRCSECSTKTTAELSISSNGSRRLT